MFLRYGDYLKFWMGLRKVLTKMCAQLHVFSLWRLTWVFDATWKVSTKKVWPVTRFFAVETILSFWWDLESFDKKVWSVTRFFAVQAISSFWWDLETFHKKVCPVTRFVRCGDYLKFWMGLGKFRQKSVISYTVFRSAGYHKFLMGFGNIFTKKCAQLHLLFDVETNLSFWWDLEKFSQKSGPSHRFLRCADYLKFLMGLRKIFTKKCAQSYVSSLWRLS